MNYKENNKYKYHNSIARDAARIWRNEKLTIEQDRYFYLLMITSQGEAEKIKKMYENE